MVQATIKNTYTVY